MGLPHPLLEAPVALPDAACLLTPRGPLPPLLLTTPKGRGRSGGAWAPIPGTYPTSSPRTQDASSPGHMGLGFWA